MAADVVPYFRPQFFDSNGKPLDGGKVYTYKAGTTTPLTTYRDAAFTPNTNPIILDSAGSADIFIGIQSVKFTIFDKNDALIKTVDQVTGANSTAVGLQTIVPITTNGVQTTFALGVEPEVAQNCTVIVQSSSGDRIVYMTSEFSVSGQNLIFNTAPPSGAGEVRIGSTRAIASAGLSDGSVTTSRIQNNAVTNAKLADNSVGTSKIQDDAVTTQNILDQSITQAKLEDLAKWSVGDIKLHHTFNGLAPVGRGWMICSGQQVLQANYDAQHGAGAWVSDGAASSPLFGKHLPNFNSKYAVGSATTTQDGVFSMSSVGNSSHQVNLQHSHQWYHSTGYSGGHDATFDSSGNSAGLLAVSKTQTGTSLKAIHLYDSGLAVTAPFTGLGDSYTNKSGSAAQNIQPESIQVLYLMKVI
jgi:hypothetical protein